MKKYYLLSFVLLAVAAEFAHASTMPCAVISGDLRQNAHGADVAALQNFLIGQNYLKTKATGLFGPATLKAVQTFQKANGLYAGGFVGPQTRAKIQSLCVVTTTLPVVSVPFISTSSASTTVSAAPLFSTTTATGSGSMTPSTQGGNSVIVSLYPDPRAAYLQIRMAYDAAQTLAAFVNVSAKYASASRQGDVVSQKADIQNLSPAEQDDYLNSSLKAVIPTAGEIASLSVAQNGATANISILPTLASGKMKGAAALVFENGAWKLQSEVWQDNGGNGVEPLPSASGG